ncbi:MAG: CDP-alcohol phosphatidyltransferase family protein [Candidatus Dadabacteria bacterium]|jgi:CDP-diacylglycerol--glycerol-3-phosphate 3-phosphatidyltransferase|nr:CDP-alcohol phosphatidyltransferase family protein [Candidatus Dadabacteria bacterium]MCZ6639828.1 CDP-alcohol phosphatidyltransferase family protein [Candidatus Dadabacteria bacterium]MCZ6685166.1 CDP-alcohol phosphatidyltransferase family protein [Candidatus Dadabacteria bacterium]
MTQPEEITQRSKNKQEPQSSKLLGSGLKTWWLLLTLPIEDYLLQIKIHPNILTISTLLVGAITGMAYHFGWIFVAGILVLGGSTFDIFDGRVARALGINSESGAFFDSCLDRFSEAFIYVGILSFFQGTIFSYIVFFILVSTTMVSYTRARAEGLGVKCEVGIMQRTERVVYLGVLSVLNFFGNQIASAMGYHQDNYLFKLALILILAFSSYTAIQRMVHVMRTLKKRESENNSEPDTESQPEITQS